MFSFNSLGEFLVQSCYCIFLKCWKESTSDATWAWSIPKPWKFLTMNSIYLKFIGLFRLFFLFESALEVRDFQQICYFISVVNLFAKKSCLKYFLLLILVSVLFQVITHIISDIGNYFFSVFFLISFARNLSILLFVFF